jgi:predicted HTH transcriptional regulator
MKVDWNLILKLNRNNRYPHSAGFQKDDCSKEAAHNVNRTLSERQKLVFNALKSHANGATSEEIAQALDKPALSVKPRLTELLLMGKIRKSGKKGKTQLGGNCHIWVVV